MPIGLTQGLRIGSIEPADARFRVATISELLTSEVFLPDTTYNGLIVYVEDTQQQYVLIDHTLSQDPTLAGWVLLGIQNSIPPSGPIGSLQYRLNAGYTSGSENLLFISASNTLTLNGTTKITGSFIQGFNNSANTWANATGFGTSAEGNYSHTEGYNTNAEAVGSHAEGSATKTVGLASYSHAEGAATIVTAQSAHAEGYQTSASANYSHAEGYATKTSGNYSHAEGYRTVTQAVGSHTEGLFTTASGQYAHAEGSGSKALGEWSHAEGRNAIANNRGTHAEGVNTYAGFVDGVTNIDEGANYSHAEGNGTRAAGFASHAEGAFTLASNQYAHAQGLSVTASGFASFAGGGSTRATAAYSTALGIKNLTTDGLLIIGNGTDPFNSGDTNRSDLAVFKTDQIILSQSIYMPDVALLTDATNKKYVTVDTVTGLLNYSSTGPSGGGGGGDITDVTAGLGISVTDSSGPEPIVSLNTSSLHFGLGVSASAAFYGFGSGGTSNLDITNNTNNNIVTATGTNTLNGESNLTFNGSRLTVNGQITATGITASLFGTSSWARNSNTASYVRGLRQRVNITGSLYISGSTSAHVPTLVVIGSGSQSSPVVEFRGRSGGLMSVYDKQSGSLLSVNDLSGLSIFDVRSNGAIYIGSAPATSLYATKKVNASVGSTTIYTIATSSYDGAFIDYTAKNGINIKVGSILATWNNGSISQQEVGTTSIGTTAGITVGIILNGANAVVTGSVTTGTWAVKTIIRSI